MDKVVEKIAALGVPGIVLTIAMAKTGFVGAAKLTAALAALGPGGMIGGIVVLLLIGSLSAAFASYGTEAVIRAVVLQELKTKSAGEIKREVMNMWWISGSLKLKIVGYIDQYAFAAV